MLKVSNPLNILFIILLALFNSFFTQASSSFSIFNGYQIKDLTAKTPLLFTHQATSWNILHLQSPAVKTMVCGTSPMLGGPSIYQSGLTGTSQRIYENLPPHTAIYYEIRFITLDSDTSEVITINFDGTSRFVGPLASYISEYPSDVCLGEMNDLLGYTVVGKVPHDSDRLELEVLSSDLYTGISSVTLNFVNPQSVPANENCFHISDTLIVNPGVSGECKYQHGKCQDPSNPANAVNCDNSCSDCFGPSSSECYSCADGYSLIGNECIKCHETCNTCSGPDEDQCITCANDLWLLWNGICKPTCSVSVDFQEQIDSFKLCKFPCQSSQYLLLDLTCENSCPIGLRKTDRYGNKICELTQDDIEEGNKMQTVLETTNKISTIQATILALVASSGPTPVLLASLSNMLEYIRYLNITYPSKVNLMFNNRNESSLDINFGVEFPESLKDDFTNYPLEGKFQEYGLSSPFIVNYWSALIPLSIIGMIITISAINLHVAKRYKLVRLVFNKIKNVTQWNLFLLVICSNLGDIGLFSALEFRTAHFDSGTSTVSFLVCLTMNILIVCILFRLILTIADVRNPNQSSVMPLDSSKGSTPAKKLWSGYEMFFENFKSDSFSQQAFIFFFLIRVMAFSMIIGHFFQYPLFQAILLVFLSLFMLGYLIIKRPFVNKYESVEFILNELIFSVVNVNIFILSILDESNSTDEKLRAKLGEVIVISNCVFNILVLITLSLEILNKFIAVYKMIKNEKGKDRWLNILLLYFGKDGLEVKERNIPEKETNKSAVDIEENLKLTSRVSSQSLSPAKPPNKETAKPKLQIIPLDIVNQESSPSPSPLKRRTLRIHGLKVSPSEPTFNFISIPSFTELKRSSLQSTVPTNKNSETDKSLGTLVNVFGSPMNLSRINGQTPSCKSVILENKSEEKPVLPQSEQFVLSRNKSTRTLQKVQQRLELKVKGL